MRLAPPRHSLKASRTTGGLLLRMRAWFARGAGVCASAPSQAQATGSGEASPVLVSEGRARSAVLLPFPIHGEALLVKLAEQLRRNCATRTLNHDPLLLTVSPRPRSRLTIDRDAYVEFDASCATYRAVVEADTETRITVETTDFDTTVQFVAQYVASRLADAVIMEAAS